MAVVTFFASRGWSIHGDKETFGSPNNEKFRMYGLLSEFYPFLKNHLKKSGISGKGHISYLTENICDYLNGIAGPIEKCNWNQIFR